MHVYMDVYVCIYVSMDVQQSHSVFSKPFNILCLPVGAGASMIDTTATREVSEAIGKL